MCRYGGKNVATSVGHIGCENDMQKITAYFLNGRMSSKYILQPKIGLVAANSRHVM